MEMQETGLSMIDNNFSVATATYTAGKYYPAEADLKQRKCKGLYSSAGGETIVVHTLRSGASSTFPAVLVAGIPFGVAFDYIVESGSSALTNVHVLPM